MKIYLAKLSIIALFTALVICYGTGSRKVRANSGGPDLSRTGAPGEQSCGTTSGCHISFAVNSGSGTLTLSGQPAEYSPNQEVTLTVTLSQSGAALFGFQITSLDDQGRQAGTLTVTEANRTQKGQRAVNNNLRQYINHNFNGVTPNGPGQNSWTLRWTAPAQSVGRVTFYVAGNAANGNGTESGDRIYTRSFSIQPASAPQTVATVSAASFQQGAASEAIQALFAAGGLASGTFSATQVPLPTTLGGVQVKVKDAAGVERDAPLFFVAPAQINFQTPLGTGNGTANVTVVRDGSTVGAGTMTVDTVAPGLFSANANGQGVPAAVALRVKSDGTQSLETISQFNSTTNRFEPAPIDLGPEGETVFLIAFGTGFRNRSSLGNVSCTMGGANATVEFASAQGGLVGLDQTNIRIPRSLAGRGTVEVNFRVNDKPANTVQIALR